MWEGDIRKTDNTSEASPAVVGMESSVFYQQFNKSRPPGVPPNVSIIDGETRGCHHIYGKALHDGRCVFGGDRKVIRSSQMVDAGSKPPAALSEDVEANRFAVKRLCPDFVNGEANRTWTGYMPFTSDGDPLLGPIDWGRAQPGMNRPTIVMLITCTASAPRVYLATGLQSSGMMTGAAPQVPSRHSSLL